jgi:hypothetical protein
VPELVAEPEQAAAVGRFLRSMPETTPAKNARPTGSMGLMTTVMGEV